MSITFVTRYGTVEGYNILPTIDPGDASAHTELYALMAAELAPGDPGSIQFGTVGIVETEDDYWTVGKIASGATLSEKLAYTVVLASGDRGTRAFYLADSILDVRRRILDEMLGGGGGITETVDDVRLTYNEADTDDPTKERLVKSLSKG